MTQVCLKNHFATIFCTHNGRTGLESSSYRPPRGRTDPSQSRRAPRAPIRGGDIDGQGRRVLPLQQEPPRPAPSPPSPPRPHLHPAAAAPYRTSPSPSATSALAAAAGPHLRRLLLHVRPRAAPGARRAARGGLRPGSPRGPAPRPGDAAPRRARPDGRAQARRRGRGRDPARGPRRAPRRRRPPLRLPGPVRRHGRADAGLLRLHGPALPPPTPRRQARRLLRQHRHPVRRPGNHRVDGDHAAGAPRHDVRAHRLHLRGGDVRDGGAPRGIAVRRRDPGRRRLEAAQRPGAGPRRAPRQVHGHACQEDGARRRCRLILLPQPCSWTVVAAAALCSVVL